MSSLVQALQLHPELAGFQIQELVWSANSLTAYEALEPEKGERVLLTRWEFAEAARSNELDPIWREQHILERLGPSAFPQRLTHIADERVSWGITDWFAGKPLATGRFDAGRSLLTVLDAIASTATLLDHLHAAGGSHGSLSPESILWCGQSRKVRFSDLGFTLFPGLPVMRGAGLRQHSRAFYLSPEATGRGGAAMDYRGDFYSLGAILYGLLVGKPPFDFDAPLQLRHAHLARSPVPPCDANDAIPIAVSDIILKLLAKTPEARYRSGAGLVSDLMRCRLDLVSNGRCDAFPLGAQDIPSRLRLSTKLYQRSEALDKLRGAYNGLKVSGRGLVTVSGYSGVGKTSLVESMRSSVLADDGFFATGKFEQSTAVEPLVGFLKAAGQLTQQLLTLPEDLLSTWRERITVSLGRHLGVLSEFVPEIEIVVGEIPPEPDLSIDEAKARFVFTVRRFFRLFTRKGSPLVVFLDDVQWMDWASKELLEDLFADPELDNFLLVTAYRENEIEPGSPPEAFIASPPMATSAEISLTPLDRGPIAEFLSDTFGSSEADCAELSELLKRKTDGNPFFLRRYVTSLYDDGIISYSAEDHSWRWDLDRIREMHVSDNLVDLMLERLKLYSAATQEDLNYLACLGGVVSHELLSLASGLAIDECARLLAEPVADGLVVQVGGSESGGQTGDSYLFVHDQIERAAYTLVEPDTRRSRHAQIAMRLHDRWQHASGPVFDLVEQLDKAQEGSASVFSGFDLATIYLSAGERAKDRTAYAAARHYLERAASFLDETAWETHYDLSSLLHRLRAEVDYQLGDMSASRSLVNVALRHCRTPEEKADLYTLLIVQNTLQGHYQESIDIGRYALSLLGFTLPQSDISDALDEEIENLASLDITAEYPRLLELAESSDPVTCKTLDILMYLIPPSYFVQPELNNLIATLMTRLSIERGISPASTKGISNFGPAIARRGRYRDGYLFARLALDLAERHGYLKAVPRVLYTLAGSLNHWVNHLRTTHAIVDDGFAQCIEQGERDYVGYLLSVARCQNEIFLGEPIDRFKLEVAKIREEVDATQNALAKGLADAAYLALSHLDGSTAEGSPFDVDGLGEYDVLESVNKHNHRLVACFFHLMKAHNQCFLEDYEQAAANIESAKRHEDSLATEMTLPMLNFFSSLCALESHAGGGGSVEERAKILAEVDRNQEVMEGWSKGCPENFAHCFLIIRAGLEAIRGDFMAAVASYGEAARAARDNGYLQFEGLAEARLGRLWLRQDRPAYARIHLARARACFERWGARRVVAHLEDSWPPEDEQEPSGARPAQAAEGEFDNEQLDLEALIEMTQRLAGEMDLARLKTELARIIVEVTGAQRVVVFLAEDGTYEPVATHDIEGPAATTDPAAHPVALVNLVGRTQEPSLVVDSKPEPSVAHDPYLQEIQPVSALCLPLVQQAKLEGVVYLENRINRMDLSDGRIRYLSVLGAQAAISIRNSLLYVDLERKVADRTEALAKLARELETRVAQQVEEIKNLEKLRRFLSPQVADLVLVSGDEAMLNSHRRRIAILFCDLRGFTAFSESVEPEEAMEMLTKYHLRMGDLIRKYQATIDHRAGDGIMAFLGDPLPSEQPIAEAVELALEMRQAARVLIEEWDALGYDLGFAIGMAYGYATIGLIGDESRMDYTATGRYANLASRLCDEAKDGQILVTRRVEAELKGPRRAVYMADLDIKGFSSPIAVYEVVE